jgi:hypothetical protein
MINRLPKEFRLPAPNGANNGSNHLPAEAGLPRRVAASAERCIAQHPIVVLSAAFVMGLIAGRIVKR